jgi:hypothetical protein
MAEELPADVVAEAERLTRLARDAVDPAEREVYTDERATLLEEYGFVPRLRERDDTLVLHPEEWVEDGTVRTGRIEDTDRAAEVSLSGPGDPEEWEEVESHNAALVATVREAADENAAAHAANARAFADFMGNHYAKRIERATADEVREFLAEYYPRNAWPSERERSLVEESLERLFAAADVPFPDPVSRGRRGGL